MGSGKKYTLEQFLNNRNQIFKGNSILKSSLQANRQQATLKGSRLFK
jgi:hypothetical protein